MAIILHVNEPTTAGVPALVRAFSAEQARRGDEVHVLAPPGMHDVPGARLHVWSLVRGRPATLRIAWSELRTLVDRLRPDVVHVHSFVAGVVARLGDLTPTGSAARRPALVYQPHAWAFDYSARPGFRRAIGTWERRASRRTDLLVTNCRDELGEGRRCGVATDAEVLGVPVDMERFHPVSRQEQLAQRQRLGLDSRYVVACVGRLTRQKNQAELVAAWERRPIPDTSLVLVGPGDPGPVAAEARQSWGRSVFAAGGQDDVRPWMWASDVLVLPSRYEGLSLVPPEAMACGRPIVGTKVNGLEEVVLGPPLKPAGAVVPHGRPDELLRLVQERLENTSLRQRESVAARRRAEELFRPDVIGDRLEAAYARALDSVRRRPS